MRIATMKTRSKQNGPQAHSLSSVASVHMKHGKQKYAYTPTNTHIKLLITLRLGRVDYCAKLFTETYVTISYGTSASQVCRRLGVCRAADTPSLTEASRQLHGRPSQKRYISPILGEAPCEQILTKFCTFVDMPDVIICANVGMEKLRGLGNTAGGQMLGSPIETTGHPYNTAALPHSL